MTNWYRVYRLQKPRNASSTIEIYYDDIREPLYLIKQITEAQATLLRLKGHQLEKIY
jgi:hypothetical protein